MDEIIIVSEIDEDCAVATLVRLAYEAMYEGEE